MPLVNVVINGRAYTLACDEGEENHLKELAVHVDQKVRDLLGSVGQVGEQRLLLMASLLMADEHQEAIARLAENDREIEALRRVQEGIGAELAKSEEIAAESLERAATRLEDVAAKLARA